MATADALSALLIYLKADPEIFTLVAERLFGAEIPENAVGTMPKKTILVRWAGGFGLQQRLYSAWRIDLYCYGETPYEAGALHRVVHERLKGLATENINGVLLYTAEASGGPISLREPDTKWPVIVQSWGLYFADDP